MLIQSYWRKCSRLDDLMTSVSRHVTSDSDRKPYQSLILTSWSLAIGLRSSITHRAKPPVANRLSHLTPLTELLSASNKAASRWPKRSWKTAVVHRNRNVQIIGCTFEDLYFHLVLLGIEFDFIDLQFQQFEAELFTGFFGPPFNLGIEHGLPSFAAIHFRMLPLRFSAGVSDSRHGL